MLEPFWDPKIYLSQQSQPPPPQKRNKTKQNKQKNKNQTFPWVGKSNNTTLWLMLSHKCPLHFFAGKKYIIKKIFHFKAHLFSHEHVQTEKKNYSKQIQYHSDWINLVFKKLDGETGGKSGFFQYPRISLHI